MNEWGFEKGDKVRVKDANPGQRDWVGKVLAVYGDGSVKVKWPKGGTVRETEETVEIANSKGVNAMAKFKVGDVVKDKAFGGPLYVVSVERDGYMVSNRPGGAPTREVQEENLVAANAKFKVGDRVRSTMGMSGNGTITKIVPGSSYLGDTCTVKWDDGAVTHPGEGQLCAANARVVNAKFKVGESVRIKKQNDPFYGKVGNVAVVTTQGSPRIYGVDIKGEKELYKENELEKMSLVSRNAVVVKALNARVKNDKGESYDMNGKKAYVGCKIEDSSRIKKTVTEVFWGGVTAKDKNGVEYEPHDGEYRIVNSLNARAVCNGVMVEIKRRASGVKTIVPIEDIRKGTEYGRDLTGYERNMLGRGIDKLESDEFVYSIVKNAVCNADPNAIAQKAMEGLGEVKYAAEQIADSVKAMQAWIDSGMGKPAPVADMKRYVAAARQFIASMK